MNQQQQYLEASQLTGENLKTIARSSSVHELSSLSLPEIDAIVGLISQVAPAGNVPGVILNGLLRLPQRLPPQNVVKRDIQLLFKGVENVLKDKAVYLAFFAGPAAILLAYQNLLKLIGREPDAAFPEGTWQFYADYALRDDTARHACETNGFDVTLRQHQITLSRVDRLTAWVMAAVHTLHQYPTLLENEWRERVYIYTLQQLAKDKPGAAVFAGLYQRWEKERPYTRAADASPQEDYPAYRRRKFDQFLEPALHRLPTALRQEWEKQVQQAAIAQLSAYRQQLHILAYLEPEAYGESRTPIPLSRAHIGLIHQGHYYLIPACQSESEKPAQVASVRTQIATLIAHPVTTPPANLMPLAALRRTAACNWREEIDPTLRQELDMLRLAPIWINADQRPSHQPLTTIRQAERGVGDHPLTIFDTGETFVFDLSHIFFDGAWGVSLAEIITNEALAWGVYLHTEPPAQPGSTRPYSPVLQLSPTDQARLHQYPVTTPEASVETEAVDLSAILSLRKRFKQRNDLLQLTVNDLLILYRAIHAATYRLSPGLAKQLETLLKSPTTHAAAKAALTAVAESQTVNPAILIPVDATRRIPRERVFPMTFEVPLAQLDLMGLHQKTMVALETAQNQKTARLHFVELRRQYLGTLAGFGEVMTKAKEIANAGESASVGTIKMLAHLPIPLQRLLDKIPGRFDVLNDIIKGREVFSNVGVVAPTSSLTRFTTAKDDNEKKELAWGVLTDAAGVMRLTLRDFRPHVGLLTAVGQHSLAVQLAQDYLNAYAIGLNAFIHDLNRLTKA